MTGTLLLADTSQLSFAVAPRVRVTARVADLVNRVEGRRGVHLPRFDWQPEMSPPQSSDAVLLELEAGGATLCVLLRIDRLIERLGLLAFADAAAGHGTALWTLRARRWWARIEAWLGTPLQLRSATLAVSVGDWPCFRLRLGRLDALLWLDPDAAARRVAAWPAEYGLPADWRDRLGGLPMACRMALNGVRLSTDELEHLAAGDVILIASRADVPLKGYLTSREVRWRCALNYEREGRVSIMENAVELMDEGAEGPRPDATIELTLELGHCVLTLAELSRLREGLVLNLHRPLDDLCIVLKRHGRRVASGQLLQVGESLGIRLAEITPRGESCP
ncbi:FliM/FliN family flagellar motor switch protein [Burkholderia pyrrocinia]|uniref:FliM/FliN family flagellar motor switch protein n=1 Tax=Burkholderia pyrrocinia TaxID=60550 RepID=UPI001404EB0A|nr:FliM/FliN family flagellar motor switch protein [Burkholderia pyrrocinia]